MEQKYVVNMQMKIAKQTKEKVKNMQNAMLIDHQK